MEQPMSTTTQNGLTPDPRAHQTCTAVFAPSMPKSSTSPGPPLTTGRNPAASSYPARAKSSGTNGRGAALSITDSALHIQFARLRSHRRWQTHRLPKAARSAKTYPNSALGRLPSASPCCPAAASLPAPASLANPPPHPSQTRTLPSKLLAAATDNPNFVHVALQSA